MMERAVNRATCTGNGECVWYFHGQRCTCSAVGSLMGLGGIHYQWVCGEQASVVDNQITPPYPSPSSPLKAGHSFQNGRESPNHLIPRGQRESCLLVTFCDLYMCAIITALAIPMHFLKTFSMIAYKILFPWVFDFPEIKSVFFPCNYQILLVHPQVFT